MIKDRTYRFIIPPLITGLAVLWGKPTVKFGIGSGVDAGEIVKLIVVGGAAVLAVGYLLGAVSTVVVRVVLPLIALVQRLCGIREDRRLSHHYQGAFTKRCYDDIERYLKSETLLPQEFSREGKRLQLVSVFRHVFPGDATRQWLIRRYAVFAISFSTFIGLAAVIGLASFTDLLQPTTDWWWGVVSAAALLMLVHGVLSHVEHNVMIEFLAECAADPNRNSGVFEPLERKAGQVSEVRKPPSGLESGEPPRP